DDLAPVLAVADLCLRRAGQVCRRAGRDDAPFTQDGDAVGELLRLVEVVRRQQDRLAERAQAADRLPGGAARGRVEAGRRLVEEDEVGVTDEREPEVEPPPLAAGERPRPR